MAFAEERTRASIEAREPVFIRLLAKFFKGLGSPTRLKILEHLLEGERNVGELVDLTGSAQGRVSSHLACLRDCGYVVRTEGRHVHYRVADPRVAEILTLGRAMVQNNAEATVADTRM